MTEAEAKARENKKVRTLDSRHGVPKGTEGIVISALPVGAVGEVMAKSGGKTPRPTEEMWMVDIEFNESLITTISLDEWDDSLEEIGSLTPRRTCAARRGREDTVA
jgi:hypothetical protein